MMRIRNFLALAALGFFNVAVAQNGTAIGGTVRGKYFDPEARQIKFEHLVNADVRIEIPLGEDVYAFGATSTAHAEFKIPLGSDEAFLDFLKDRKKWYADQNQSLPNFLQTELVIEAEGYKPYRDKFNFSLGYPTDLGTTLILAAPIFLDTRDFEENPAVVVFASGAARSGDLKGLWRPDFFPNIRTPRDAVDKYCKRTPEAKTYLDGWELRAFVSVDKADAIGQFTSLYGFPSEAPVYSIYGVPISDSFGAFSKGKPLLNAIGEGGMYSPEVDGSLLTGENPVKGKGVDPSTTCNSWTAGSAPTSFYGGIGKLREKENWMRGSKLACNAFENVFMVCVAHKSR